MLARWGLGPIGATAGSGLPGRRASSQGSGGPAGAARSVRGLVPSVRKVAVGLCASSFPATGALLPCAGAAGPAGRGVLSGAFAKIQASGSFGSLERRLDVLGTFAAGVSARNGSSGPGQPGTAPGPTAAKPAFPHEAGPRPEGLEVKSAGGRRMGSRLFREPPSPEQPIPYRQVRDRHPGTPNRPQAIT